MPLRRYDVLDELSHSAKWIEKYWNPVNCPVLGPGSREVVYVVHRVRM